VLLAASHVALGDEVRLSSQSHREVWENRSGQAPKDFEWTLAPVISNQSGALDVSVQTNLTKHADGFAGVIGEIDFCCGPRYTLELTFDDGSTKTVSGDLRAHLESAELGQRRLVKIRVSSELVGRKWQLDWIVQFPPLPNDWVLATRELAPVKVASGEGKGGTWLTPTEIKNRPQELTGIWIEANADPDTEQSQWFETDDDSLKIYPLSDPGSAWVFLEKQGRTDRWSGSGGPPGQEATGVSICPRPKGTCLQL